jgi:hypothetical protein
MHIYIYVCIRFVYLWRPSLDALAAPASTRSPFPVARETCIYKYIYLYIVARETCIYKYIYMNILA